jgi:hypothetical protein
MPKLRNDVLPHDTQATGVAFHGANRGVELAAYADLMLARYPVYIREQVTELLMVLAAKPGQAEKGVP